MLGAEGGQQEELQEISDITLPFAISTKADDRRVRAVTISA
jgi:hypothetical protein